MPRIDTGFFSYATLAVRFVLPVLAIIIIVRCVRSLLRKRGKSETWGYFSLPNGARIELNHWENVIGRAKTSDAYMEYPTLSRNHAAVIRDGKGKWRIYDTESLTGVIINGEKIDSNGGTLIKTGDIIELGGVKLVFIAEDDYSKIMPSGMNSDLGKKHSPPVTLAFLMLFQILLGAQLCLSKGSELILTLPLAFLALIALGWISYGISKALRRHSFEIETLAFFLCTVGFSVIATGSQTELARQVVLLVFGISLYFVLSWFLRNLDRVNKLRLAIGAAGLILLAITVFFAPPISGARRWVFFGGVSFQPSEIVKIAFIFVGAATMDRLLKRHNLLLFIGFSAACVAALVLITDFGSALIFFVAYLVIAFLRSGDFATILLSIGGAVFGGLMALQFWSHIASRFATWGNAWDYDNMHNSGYQQTRAMAAAASGGLFGVGAGKGWFYTIRHADTDVVFGIISEELGLIVAVTAICAILTFAVFSVWTAGESRSSFYVIAACAASSILVIQMILNVFGSVDLLPFTGVTFPFVSKGGTSLVACWGMLAFIKAADTRQNTRFAL